MMADAPHRPPPTPPAPEVVLFPVANIVVGTRHRRELEDEHHTVADLAASIATVGLLHFPVILASGALVAGERRLAAVRALGWERVPCHVARSLDGAHQLLLAEVDENRCRKPFTPSEAVAVAEALRPLAEAEAQRRQREHGRTAPGRPAANTGAKLAPVKGSTRKRLAGAVGMSHGTLEKARKVVGSGHGDLVARMDATGKVDGAYRELRRRETGGRPLGAADARIEGMALALEGFVLRIETALATPDGLDAACAVRIRAAAQRMLELLPATASPTIPTL